MVLPPGTLRALKGQHDDIVIVVLAVMAFGAMAAKAPAWAAMGALAVLLLVFHIRRCAAELHQREMAQIRVTDAAIWVEATKARYRELYSVGEPELDLQRPRRRLAGGRTKERGDEHSQ